MVKEVPDSCVESLLAEIALSCCSGFYANKPELPARRIHYFAPAFRSVTNSLKDLKPSGKYVMEDVHKIGGTPAITRFLLEQGFLDGDCITVTGQTLAENAKLYPALPDSQQIIRPLSNPIKETGHIQILYGNLAPEGSVAKITGKEGLYFSGPALVFEGEETMIAALAENPSSFKDILQRN